MSITDPVGDFKKNPNDFFMELEILNLSPNELKSVLEKFHEAKLEPKQQDVFNFGIGKILYARYLNNKEDLQSLATACLAWSKVTDAANLSPQDNLYLGEVLTSGDRNVKLFFGYCDIDKFRALSLENLLLAMNQPQLKVTDVKVQQQAMDILRRELKAPSSGHIELDELCRTELPKLEAKSMKFYELGWEICNNFMKDFLEFLVNNKLANKSTFIQFLSAIYKDKEKAEKIPEPATLYNALGYIKLSIDEQEIAKLNRALLLEEQSELRNLLFSFEKDIEALQAKLNPKHAQPNQPEKKSISINWPKADRFTDKFISMGYDKKYPEVYQAYYKAIDIAKKKSTPEEISQILWDLNKTLSNFISPGESKSGLQSVSQFREKDFPVFAEFLLQAQGVVMDLRKESEELKKEGQQLKSKKGSF